MKFHIDRSWCLFLDRDGVLNQRLFGGYVTHWADFAWTSNMPAAAGQLATPFAHVFVITNQQCVAKGLATAHQINELHAKMQFELGENGMSVSAIQVATEAKGAAPMRRKPSPQMALELKERFPEIDFQKSIMVGDTDSDVQFGKQLGMKTVLIRSEEVTHEVPDLYIDHLSDLMAHLS
ncbi:MAG: hypothetical protein RLZZ301_221 [Bacteroidota bacterium]|jgi:histidinol-phosphate phosphatase family protein